jgi:hypothetical protein
MYVIIILQWDIKRLLNTREDEHVQWRTTTVSVKKLTLLNLIKKIGKLGL